MLKGLEHLMQERLERAGSVHPGEENDQRNLINIYKYLMGGSKADKAGFPSVVASDWTGATEHRLKYRRFQLNIKKTFFYCGGGQAFGNLVQRGCRVSIPGEGQNSSGCSPEEIICVGELTGCLHTSNLSWSVIHGVEVMKWYLLFSPFTLSSRLQDCYFAVMRMSLLRKKLDRHFLLPLL